jgi:hypothetical protein
MKEKLKSKARKSDAHGELRSFAPLSHAANLGWRAERLIRSCVGLPYRDRQPAER